MKEIVMPKLSDTMTEGTLISWKKKVGDKVNRGDVIAEVETDKANMELEAYASGVLLEISIEPGESAEVGTVIGLIGDPGEAPSGGKKEEKGAAAAPSPPAQPAVPKEEGAPAVRQQAPAPKEEAPAGQAPAPPAAGQEGEAGEEFVTAVSAEAPRAPTPPEAKGKEEKKGAAPQRLEGETVERAAPVVRKRARELGIDLSAVHGSGPEGRILMQDLEGAAGAAPLPREEVSKTPRGEARPLSRQRSAIARTVSESWRSIPHFSVTVEILMDEAEKLRHELKEGGVPLSVNDLVVKGAALALEKYPELNASFAGDSIRQGSGVNICIAVTIPDGLVMPVIAGCESLSLKEISERSRTLVERARGGHLTEQEMSGGTFSVSNLGMFGVSEFNAIIYPSQAAVLAVGAVTDAVVPKGGMPAVGKVMKVTLSADHRVVDGAYAAQFLAQFKEVLEHPLRLFL